MSSTATFALFTLVALRPAHAQTTPEVALAPSTPPTPTGSEHAVAAPPEAVPNPAPNGESSPTAAASPPVAPAPAPTTNSNLSRAERSLESTRSTDAAPDAPQSDAADTQAPSVQLEDPEPSQGHFVAVGVHGVGAMAFDESRGTRKPTVGTGFSLRLGESLTDWLSLSLSLALGFTGGEPRDSLTFGRFGVTSQWYFTERWFLQAGFAAAYAKGPDPEDHKRSRSRYGEIYLMGIGRDFYISDGGQSGGWVITPLLTVDVGPDSKLTTTSLWLGVELSWWTGLTQDKLNLPTTKAYTK